MCCESVERCVAVLRGCVVRVLKGVLQRLMRVDCIERVCCESVDKMC